MLWDALVGRGIRPYSLWLCAVGIPCTVTLHLAHADAGGGASGRRANGACATDADRESLFALHVFFACVVGWTIPWDWVAGVLGDVGKLRECLADCAPYAPGLVPYLPQILPPIILNIHRVAPVAGSLAPYLKYLLPYPAFIAKALPHLIKKIELAGPLIDQIGPKFKEMDARHFAKLELIIEDLVDQLEELLPHFHVIAPHIVEIALRADKLFPIVHYLIPHVNTMGHHIWWLIPFADVEGFEELVPYIDRLAPHIEEFAEFGPMLLPYMSKMRKHIPILLDNVDALLPQLGSAIDYIDPIVYWLADLLPLANSVGILRSKLLLRAGTPFARFLPSVPKSSSSSSSTPAAPTGSPTGSPSESPTLESDEELWRLNETRRMVSLDKAVRNVKGVNYYVLRINGRYSGEFRYSHLRELDETVVQPALREKFTDGTRHRIAGRVAIPAFPPRRGVDNASPKDVEARREALEKYLIFVFSEPDIVGTKAFVEFVRARRRWVAELPQLASPLMGGEESRRI